MKLREIILLDCAIFAILVLLPIVVLPELMPITALLFCGVNFWGVTHYVVRPLESINRLIVAFRADSQILERVPPRGSSEIVQLGKQLNEMIEQIQESQRNLIAAREKLKFEATHDALTGAWNCSAALELLDREIARGERENTTVAVLMLDLDHFKKVNDKFGHQAGDLVLQAVTASVAQILRSSDVLARYGGEEFIVIAPDCNGGQAERLAERIRMRLDSTPIRFESGEVRATTSIGVAAASFPLTSEELIALADRALYRAKANGRNCVARETPAHRSVKATLYAMPRREV